VTCGTAFACGLKFQPSEGLEMPTDLEAVFARKREMQREKQKERQSNATVLSVWVIICLVMLVLVFVDNSYAQAVEEMMDLF
jgi:hypothetical protein